MKKKTSKLFLLGALTTSIFLTNCDQLDQVIQTTETVMSSGGGTSAPALTNDEVISGLKEALTKGISEGADVASMTDGFFKNPKIKLPFPPDAQKVKDKAIELGMQNKVDEFELTLNRAAEAASKEAKPIFVDAIKQMTIGDGFAILKGSDTAATAYLREKTTASLKQAFSPKVQTAIESVKLTNYWEPLTKAYNASTLLTGKDEVNTDLNAYVTDKAVNGLFYLIAQKETEIRKDPVARTTDLLKKVFSTLDN